MLAMFQKRKKMLCLNNSKTKTHEIEQMNTYAISKLWTQDPNVIFSQMLLMNMGWCEFWYVSTQLNAVIPSCHANISIRVYNMVNNNYGISLIAYDDIFKWPSNQNGEVVFLIKFKQDKYKTHRNIYILCN